MFSTTRTTTNKKGPHATIMNPMGGGGMPPSASISYSSVVEDKPAGVFNFTAFENTEVLEERERKRQQQIAAALARERRHAQNKSKVTGGGGGGGVGGATAAAPSMAASNSNGTSKKKREKDYYPSSSNPDVVGNDDALSQHSHASKANTTAQKGHRRKRGDGQSDTFSTGVGGGGGADETAENSTAMDGGSDSDFDANDDAALLLAASEEEAAEKQKKSHDMMLSSMSRAHGGEALPIYRDENDTVVIKGGNQATTTTNKTKKTNNKVALDDDDDDDEESDDDDNEQGNNQPRRQKQSDDKSGGLFHVVGESVSGKHNTTSQQQQLPPHTQKQGVTFVQYDDEGVGDRQAQQQQHDHPTHADDNNNNANSRAGAVAAGAADEDNAAAVENNNNNNATNDVAEDGGGKSSKKNKLAYKIRKAFKKFYKKAVAFLFYLHFADRAKERQFVIFNNQNDIEGTVAMLLAIGGHLFYYLNSYYDPQTWTFLFAMPLEGVIVLIRVGIIVYSRLRLAAIRLLIKELERDAILEADPTSLTEALRIAAAAAEDPNRAAGAAAGDGGGGMGGGATMRDGGKTMLTTHDRGGATSGNYTTNNDTRKKPLHETTQERRARRRRKQLAKEVPNPIHLRREAETLEYHTAMWNERLVYIFIALNNISCFVSYPNIQYCVLANDSIPERDCADSFWIWPGVYAAMLLYLFVSLPRLMPVTWLLVVLHTVLYIAGRWLDPMTRMDTKVYLSQSILGACICAVALTFLTKSEEMRREMFVAIARVERYKGQTAELQGRLIRHTAACVSKQLARHLVKTRGAACPVKADGSIVTVRFAKFTEWCSRNSGREISFHLKALYSACDRAAIKSNVHHIATFGDLYVAAAGLDGTLTPQEAAECSCVFAAALLMNRKNTLRVHIASGPINGIISANPNIMCQLFGNTAHEMQAIPPNEMPDVTLCNVTKALLGGGVETLDDVIERIRLRDEAAGLLRTEDSTVGGVKGTISTKTTLNQQQLRDLQKNDSYNGGGGGGTNNNNSVLPFTPHNTTTNNAYTNNSSVHTIHLSEHQQQQQQYHRLSSAVASGGGGAGEGGGGGSVSFPQTVDGGGGVAGGGGGGATSSRHTTNNNTTNNLQSTISAAALFSSGDGGGGVGDGHQRLSTLTTASSMPGWGVPTLTSFNNNNSVGAVECANMAATNGKYPSGHGNGNGGGGGGGGGSNLGGGLSSSNDCRGAAAAAGGGGGGGGGGPPSTHTTNTASTSNYGFASTVTATATAASHGDAQKLQLLQNYQQNQYQQQQGTGVRINTPSNYPHSPPPHTAAAAAASSSAVANNNIRALSPPPPLYPSSSSGPPPTVGAMRMSHNTATIATSTPSNTLNHIRNGGRSLRDIPNASAPLSATTSSLSVFARVAGSTMRNNTNTNTNTNGNNTSGLVGGGGGGGVAIMSMTDETILLPTAAVEIENGIPSSSYPTDVAQGRGGVSRSSGGGAMMMDNALTANGNTANNAINRSSLRTLQKQHQDDADDDDDEAVKKRPLMQHAAGIETTKQGGAATLLLNSPHSPSSSPSPAKRRGRGRGAAEVLAAAIAAAAEAEAEALRTKATFTQLSGERYYVYTDLQTRLDEARAHHFKSRWKLSQKFKDSEIEDCFVRDVHIRIGSSAAVVAGAVFFCGLSLGCLVLLFIDIRPFEYRPATTFSALMFTLSTLGSAFMFYCVRRLKIDNALLLFFCLMLVWQCGLATSPRGMLTNNLQVWSLVLYLISYMLLPPGVTSTFIWVAANGIIVTVPMAIMTLLLDTFAVTSTILYHILALLFLGYMHLTQEYSTRGRFLDMIFSYFLAKSLQAETFVLHQQLQIPTQALSLLNEATTVTIPKLNKDDTDPLNMYGKGGRLRMLDLELNDPVEVQQGVDETAIFVLQLTDSRGAAAALGKRLRKEPGVAQSAFLIRLCYALCDDAVRRYGQGCVFRAKQYNGIIVLATLRDNVPAVGHLARVVQDIYVRLHALRKEVVMTCTLGAGNLAAAIVGDDFLSFEMYGDALQTAMRVVHAAPPGSLTCSDRFYFIYQCWQDEQMQVYDYYCRQEEEEQFRLQQQLQLQQQQQQQQQAAAATTTEQQRAMAVVARSNDNNANNEAHNTVAAGDASTSAQQQQKQEQRVLPRSRSTHQSVDNTNNATNQQNRSASASTFNHTTAHRGTATTPPAAAGGGASLSTTANATTQQQQRMRRQAAALAAAGASLSMSAAVRKSSVTTASMMNNNANGGGRSSVGGQSANGAIAATAAGGVGGASVGGMMGSSYAQRRLEHQRRTRPRIGGIGGEDGSDVIMATPPHQNNNTTTTPTPTTTFPLPPPPSSTHATTALPSPPPISLASSPSPAAEEKVVSDTTTAVARHHNTAEDAAPPAMVVEEQQEEDANANNNDFDGCGGGSGYAYEQEFSNPFEISEPLPWKLRGRGVVSIRYVSVYAYDE